MRKKKAVFRSRSFQLKGKQAPPDASCDKQSMATVTKCTSVCFTLPLHYISLISMGIKYLALFLVENILHLKLLDRFLASFLISFKHHV